jgi:hypothetical protein
MSTAHDPATGIEPRVEPFANILAALQGGRTHRELGRALQDLTAAVKETGKGGSLTLTIKVSPSKAYGRVDIEDKVASKLPEPDRFASIFFVDDDNNLTRTDPNQLELPVGPRAVDTERTAN